MPTLVASIIALFLFISAPPSIAGCGSLCSTSAQCANPCPICFDGECGSCCDQLNVEDEAACQSASLECYWNTDTLECEDSPGLGCPNQEIPENPKGSPVIWLGLALFVLSGVAWKFRRPIKTSSS